METEDILDREMLESKIEDFVAKSKKYIDSRDEDELESLRQDIDTLKLKLSQALENNSTKEDINYLTAMKLMLKIINKFTSSVSLMENLKSKQPLHREFDTNEMLDILLPHIKNVVEYDKWSESLDTSKIEEDCQLLDSLEDQHKRVLVTYLVQDWHNMDQVITLLKIGETYKNIAEHLISLSLISSYLKRH